MAKAKTKTKTASKAAAKKAPAKKVASKKAAPKTAPVKKVAAKKAPVKAPAKKTAAKKAPTKKAVAKKTPAKKAAAKKSPAKTPAKKAVAKKAAVKKAPVKKAAITKTPAKKAPTKKAPATKKAASKKAPTTGRKGAVAGASNFTPYRKKSHEEYMNDTQKDHFRGLLNSWKADLMEEVDRTVSHMKDEAANFPDPADRATQEEEFSLELRTRDRERKLIKKIESTMEKIDQDDYGWCDSCGIEIGVQRLEARPTATLCIDCKTLDEIKERQERG